MHKSIINRADICSLKCVIGFSPGYWTLNYSLNHNQTLVCIYIHLPFCKQACNYCNFHFSTSLRYKNELVLAILREVELRKEYLGEEVIETIYFGGGTPSLLDISDIRQILDTIKTHFQVDIDAELTLEANPDDIGAEKLELWKSEGINKR